MFQIFSSNNYFTFGKYHTNIDKAKSVLKKYFKNILLFERAIVMDLSWLYVVFCYRNLIGRSGVKGMNFKDDKQEDID